MMRNKIVRCPANQGAGLRRQIVRRRWQIRPPFDPKRTLRGALLTTFATIAATLRATAQGCAMCYQNAAASGAQGRVALRHAILILLLPAVTLFFGVFGLVYRRRNSGR